MVSEQEILRQKAHLRQEIIDRITDPELVAKIDKYDYSLEELKFILRNIRTITEKRPWTMKFRERERFHLS